MRKSLLIGFSIMPLVAGIGLMEVGERGIAASAYVLLLLFIVFLYRRFRRAAAHVPRIFHASAAIAVSVGLITMVSGMIHSAAVTAVAFDERQWVPLTILRFTTGALLMYAGATSVVLHRAIRNGKHWAVGVSAATSFLFWSYLLFLFPLPGTGGTVPPMLGMWTAYLVWLGAAVFAMLPRNAPRLDVIH